MGVCGGLAKIIIGFFSILLFLIGIAFLAVGGIVAVEFREYADANLFKNYYLWGPVAVGIVLGVFLMLLGVFGLIGVCCEKKSLIKAFAVMMVILIILEIVVAVLVYVYRDNLEKELQTGIEDGIAKAYNGSNTDTVTLNALNKLQETLNCCGGNGTQDYTSQGLTIPDACCVTVTAGCSNSTAPSTFNTQGCTSKLNSLYRRYANVFFGVAIAFGVLELLAVVYSCWAANQEESKLV